MTRKNGEWTIHKSSTKFQNDFIEVVEDTVTQPDGEPGSYATVRMKPGVCVLPIDDENFVYLTKQFRYAAERESLEALCCGVDENDSLAAKREAREKSGIEAEEWQEFASIEMDTSIINSPVHLFIARKLRFTNTEQEGSENIKTVKLKFAEAIEKALSGVIVHAPSCVLLLKAAQLRTEKSQS